MMLDCSSAGRAAPRFAACHDRLSPLSEPACLTACPVNAYEKDPLTGIVKHLDDQCFGCQYCTLACPYEVPKYHAAKGIVRKCDMCSSRLAVGEAPACVQACPSQAIAIRVVSVESVIEDAEAALFLPAAPIRRSLIPRRLTKANVCCHATCCRPTTFKSVGSTHTGRWS